MKLKTVLFVVALAAILGLTFGGTHVAMSQYTATEWDEPVYGDVVRAVLVQGKPSFLSGEKIRQEYYAANPPFHFFVLAAWDSLTQGGVASIEGHRLFSSIIATLTVMMSMVCVYQVTMHRKRPTLFVGIILATDGWFSYTSLLVKLDTTAILIGLIGVALLHKGIHHKKIKWSRWYQIIGGLVIGLAAAYKHVAVVFVLALFIQWMYFAFWLRRRSFLHWAFVASVLVVIAYVVIMIATVGDDYTNATLQQIYRVTGGRSSSGLNPSLATAIQVLIDTYTAFLGSVGISIFGGALAFASVGTAIIGVLLQRREKRKNEEKRKNGDFVQKILFLRPGSPISFFVALTICSIGFLTLIQLRNPHYLGYGIDPIAIVVSYWIDRAMDGSARFSVLLSAWFGRKIDLRRFACVVAYTLLATLMILNARTIVIRVFDFGEKDDVIGSAIEVIRERVPLGSHIIANEPICRALAAYDYRCVDFRDMIKQPQIDAFRPDVIVDYSTPTTHRPQSNAISVLLSRIDPDADILGKYDGWKRDKISVIVVNPSFKPLPVKEKR